MLPANQHSVPAMAFSLSPILLLLLFFCGDPFSAAQVEVLENIIEVANPSNVAASVNELRKELRTRLDALHKSLVCQPPFVLVRDRQCLFVSKERESWATARQKCRSMGAQLAVADSMDEMKAIREALPQESSFCVGAWIGLRFVNDTHGFLWVDGTKNALPLGLGPGFGFFGCVYSCKSNAREYVCHEKLPYVCRRRIPNLGLT